MIPLTTSLEKGRNGFDSGTWILSGDNSWSGTTKINWGVLTLAKPASLPNVAQVSFQSRAAADEACIGLMVGGGGFSSGQVDALINTLAFQGDSSSSVGFDTFNGDFTHGTAITKAIGVSKLGPNTLTLTGASTYDGSSRIKEGRLLINGSTAPAIAGRQLNFGSSMIVEYDGATGGGTLGGSGTVGGVTWVKRGGRIQGGDAGFAGTLTLGGLVLGNNNEDDWSRLRFTIAPGGQIATTSFEVNGTNHLVQILDPTLAVGTNTLITYTGGSIGGSNGFGGLRLDEGSLPAGVTANLLDTGSEVQLAVTSVPVVEPPTLGYTVLGGGVIELSWTNAWSFKLQSQTNLLSVGLGTNWADYADTGNPVNVTNDPANPAVFFRLISAP